MAIAGLFASFLDDVFNGNIDTGSDTFYGMLVDAPFFTITDYYSVCDRRDDVTDEITATGYTAGGNASGVTVTQIAASRLQRITFGPVQWTGFTGTASGIVYYKHRGGAASADELCGFVDFEAPVTRTAELFYVTPTIIEVNY